MKIPLLNYNAVAANSGESQSAGGFESLYGKPVSVPVTIGGIELGSGKPGHINIQPMVTFNCSKTIKEESIVGGRYGGSVKEFINIGDYTIKISGAVVNSENQAEYPTQQLEVLKKLWEINKAVDFKCEISDGLFDRVVIKSIQLDELKKAPGVQYYTIDAVSETLQEVELLKGEEVKGNANS